MKPYERVGVLEGTPKEFTRVTYHVQANTFKLHTKNLYKYKYVALFREPLNNSADQYARMGIEGGVIEITMPTEDDPVLRIRDYASGINEPSKMFRHFFDFNASDKTQEENSTGQMGIGAKVAYVVSDQFFVTTFDGERKRTYHAFIDEQGFPCRPSEAPPAIESDEPQGLLLEIPIDMEEHQYRNLRDGLDRALRGMNHPNTPCQCNIYVDGELHKPTDTLYVAPKGQVSVFEVSSKIREVLEEKIKNPRTNILVAATDLCAFQLTVTNNSYTNTKHNINTFFNAYIPAVSMGYGADCNVYFANILYNIRRDSYVDKNVETVPELENYVPNWISVDVCLPNTQEDGTTQPILFSPNREEIIIGESTEFVNKLARQHFYQCVQASVRIVQEKLENFVDEVAESSFELRCDAFFKFKFYVKGVLEQYPLSTFDPIFSSDALFEYIDRLFPLEIDARRRFLPTLDEVHELFPETKEAEEKFTEVLQSVRLHRVDVRQSSSIAGDLYGDDNLRDVLIHNATKFPHLYIYCNGVTITDYYHVKNALFLKCRRKASMETWKQHVLKNLKWPKHKITILEPEVKVKQDTLPRVKTSTLEDLQLKLVAESYLYIPSKSSSGFDSNSGVQSFWEDAYHGLKYQLQNHSEDYTLVTIPFNQYRVFSHQSPYGIRDAVRHLVQLYHAITGKDLYLIGVRGATANKKQFEELTKESMIDIREFALRFFKQHRDMLCFTMHIHEVVLPFIEKVQGYNAASSSNSLYKTYTCSFPFLWIHQDETQLKSNSLMRSWIRRYRQNMPYKEMFSRGNYAKIKNHLTSLHHAMFTHGELYENPYQKSDPILGDVQSIPIVADPLHKDWSEETIEILTRVLISKYPMLALQNPHGTNAHSYLCDESARVPEHVMTYVKAIDKLGDPLVPNSSNHYHGPLSD